MLNKRSKEDLQQMGSLIDNENKGHISSNINEMIEYRVLRGRIYSVGFQPDERVIPFLELAGFGSATLIQTFDLRYDLISALIERWRPETHTFYLSCGECTITLEDVAVQLGLPIDGNVVTGVSSISSPALLCYELLGRFPSEGKFATLRFSWLKANFEHLPNIATELEVKQATRGYIMHLIGGVLMPDSHGSEVSLMYLPLLSNLHNTRSYSWGSAVLATLYRELCRTTDPSAMDIGGCLILLQSWALYRMPFLASISHQPYIFPLVNRWSTNSGIGRSYTVPIYRLMIENYSREGVAWEGAGPGGGGQGHVAGYRAIAPLQQVQMVAPPGLARPCFDPIGF
ncbi:protein MAIN-LIKE 2-like [Gossypium hirsutum]|uniref:Protein MAIN-LIKE 2-like n=1 Tax=Gossypium hirsutum TaxID=3635 RepID=A0ABM2ZDE3_GOSHI|nr:protein MAIN-LIKE 2-like [Gossypium hirsutum]